LFDRVIIRPTKRIIDRLREMGVTAGHRFSARRRSASDPLCA
jgi:Fe2+ transport system protein FeoA